MEKPLERVVFSCAWYNGFMAEETISKETSASNSSKWDILKDYDAKQQRILNTQVDYLRGKRVGSGPQYSRERKFEKNGIEKQPTLLKKLARAVMLATFGLPKREEERMYREAMPAALEKWNKEKEDRENRILEIQQKALEKEEAKAKFLKGVEEENQRKLEEARQKLREEREQREAEKMHDELIAEQHNENFMVLGGGYDLMDEHREMQKKRFEKQRIQEIIELDLEKELTKVEDLEIYSSAEGTGVEKRMEEYGDKPIEVYDLKGYPFAFLQTDISYRLSDEDVRLIRKGEESKTTHKGIDTAARLYMDPSAWNINEEDTSGLPDDGKNAYSNAIKTSFRRSSDKSIEQRHYIAGRSICYGFESVTGGQLISVDAGDGGTPTRYEKDTNSLNDVNAVEDAIEKTPAKQYNELVIKRFNENGAVRKPDYIVTENGDITEDMKKHAAYWGIPIINIDMEYYPDQE